MPKYVAAGLALLTFMAWFHETMKPSEVAQASPLTEYQPEQTYTPPPETQPKSVEVQEETKPEPKKEEAPKPKHGAWQGLVDYAKANPFEGAVFTEGSYKGNHLQIALDLRMPSYQGIKGCHPFLIAAIHYSETGLQMSNGANGQGVFQAYSSGIRYPANSYPDNFKEQAQQACDTLRGKVGGADLSSLDDMNLIGEAFAKYNGCWAPGAGIYANTQDTWHLCPYTANKMNDKSQGMLQCAVDGCASLNHRSSYGTMAFVAHLLANFTGS